MPKTLDFDAWEKEFIELFKKKVDEEPLYEYAHLHRKGLSPEKAVTAYIKENPDYEEKIEDLTDPVSPHHSGTNEPKALSAGEIEKKVQELKIREEAKKRLADFCPECARKMGGKKICKCGYKKPAVNK